ncbi:hypothetical protein HDV00_010642 [Rhizophlyctis rosea]|nr:hypothetical protein HDV00_010642 [Rhizophlyctis rosea]
MKYGQAITSVAFAAALAGNAFALAPLESNQIYFGAWLDTSPSSAGFDSPVAFNKRLGHNAAMFQLSEDFPLDFNAPPPVEILDYTQTDALLYLTIYPSKKNVTVNTSNQALAQFSDSDLSELVKQVVGYVVRGRKVFIRLFPEMNGSWNPWGQRPVAFVAQWQRIVNAIRSAPALPADKKDWIAFIWAPSAAVTRSGGYPFPGGLNTPFTPNTFSAGTSGFPARTAANATEFAKLDTNGDGVFDAKDDPYAPYYPGDSYVDWVGLSIYYYGNVWPWGANELPADTSFVEQITGTPPGQPASVNFYDVYSTKANKPMFVTETASSFHESYVNGTAISPGPGALAIHQKFWKQYITSSSFLNQYSKIKALCLFEFEKPEEATNRDFRITHDSNILAAFKSDFEASDVLSKYIFANCTQGAVNCTGSTSSTTGGGSSKSDAGLTTSASGLWAGLLSVAGAGLWAII